MSGKIVSLLISQNPKNSMQEVNQIVLEEGKGIFGDKYYNQEGTFSKKGEVEEDRHVTLLEVENINSFNERNGKSINYKDLGKNIIISNCDLNNLVDKEFQIGNVVLKGIKLCEPCEYLADKSGLRAEIIKGGSIDMTSQLEV